MPLVFNIVDKNAFYSAMTAGTVDSLIGLATLIKVRNGSNFAKVISLQIFLQWLTKLAGGLCFAINAYACFTFSTDNNLKDMYLILAISYVFTSHFWLFSMKYVETGVLYAFSFLPPKLVVAGRVVLFLGMVGIL